MTELIILLLLNSLYIIGFYHSVDYEIKDKVILSTGEVKKIPHRKQALWFVAYYTDWLPQFIKIPLYDCIKCMASIHSVYIYWAVYDFTIINLFIYFFYIFALSGLNTLYEKHLDA